MFNIPKTGHLFNVDRYEVNGRLMAVFASSAGMRIATSADMRIVYCAAMPDCEFSGNQLRKFYKYAFNKYALSKSDFYGKYSEHDSCYERTVEGQFVTKRLFIVGSEAYVKAIAEEWEKHI